jgi:hypothetical protein
VIGGALEPRRIEVGKVFRQQRQRCRMGFHVSLNRWPEPKAQLPNDFPDLRRHSRL